MTTKTEGYFLQITSLPSGINIYTGRMQGGHAFAEKYNRTLPTWD